MYQIHVDKPHEVIEVQLGGMMTVEEVAEYIAELQRLFIVHKLRTYAMVIDVSDCPIQSQDMIAAMGKHMAAMPKARALAVVTGSSLAKMQVRRIFTQAYTRIVTNIAEGRAWVFHGEEPSRP